MYNSITQLFISSEDGYMKELEGLLTKEETCLVCINTNMLALPVRIFNHIINVLGPSPED